MAETLIITGWGHDDYACAAAVVLMKYPDAEVVGASKRRLPEMFEELAKGKELSLKRIFILGVPTTAEPQRFISTCAKLASRNVKIEFISCYPLPDGMTEKLGRKLFPTIADDPDEQTLTELVSRRFELDSAKTRVGFFIRIAVTPERKLSKADLAWCKLIAAAASRYRSFQDTKAYGKAIVTLAKGISPDERQKAMIEEYIKNGRRELKGRSKAIEELWELIATLGKEGNCRILITGETGTGKETVANLIHGYSTRGEECDGFIAFNCADLSPQLLESRLFGHVKGAFTGADRERRGAFDLANGGTLFLDEVGELSLNAQAGLLRVIQESRFTPLGGEEEKEVDVRIIAATNRPLPEMIAKGEFRQDLFYRLNVMNVHIPPLRERPEDIEDIANFYMRGRGQKILDKEQIADLQTYSWPGNIRELENILERSIILSRTDFKSLLQEHQVFLAGAANSAPSSEYLEDVIKAHIKKVYNKCGGNLSRTAKVLDLGSVNTIKKYLKS